METTDTVEMFLRSISIYNLMYDTLVDDGDSISFGNVKEKCYEKYGYDYNVTKEECVGRAKATWYRLEKL